MSNGGHLLHTYFRNNSHTRDHLLALAVTIYIERFALYFPLQS